MKHATLISMLAVGAAAAAQGDVWRLWQNEAGKDYTSLTNAYGWVDNSAGTTHSGEDGAPLSSDEAYLIRGGYSLWTPGGGLAADSFAFPGSSLTLGTVDQEGRIRHKLYGAAVMDWDDHGANGGLVLVNGYYMTYYSGVTPLVSDIYGSVKVESTAGKPYRFGFSTANVRMNLHGDFSGGEDAAVRFSGVNYGSSALSLVNGSSFRFSGEWTNYFGTVEVTNTTVAFGTTVMPGTLELDGKSALGTVAADDVFTVDTLTMAEGATIVMNADASASACGLIAVTNAFNAVAEVTIEADASVYEGIETAVYLPVLSAPVSAGLCADGFTVKTGDGEVIPGIWLTVERDAETGTDTLVVAYAPSVVYQTVSDGNIRDSNSQYTSSFDDKTHWSDEKTPHDNSQYVVRKIESKTTMLRTPVDPETDYTFPGERLIIEDGCQFGLFCKSISFKELVLGDGVLFMLGQGVSKGVLSGRLSVPEGNVSLCAYNGAEFTIAADIVGSARLVFDGSHANTSGRRATTELTGENSRFTGTITVGLNRDPDAVEKNYFQTLSVSDPVKLGAPLAAFDPTALVLKRLARLSAVGSVSFDDPTRGIYIGEDGSSVGGQAAPNAAGTFSDGQLSVDAGETLAIRTQLTLNGHLRKYGEGTLALGGPLKFGPATSISEQPVAGSNRCSVAEGSVKPLAADSFNGMEMTFAAGTGIRLDIVPGGDALKTFGLRNTKAAVPFAAEGRIPVGFDVPEGFVPPLPFTVGVVTVKNDLFDAVRGMLEIENPSLGCCMITDAVTDGDFTTLTVTFKKVGTVLSIR